MFSINLQQSLIINGILKSTDGSDDEKVKQRIMIGADVSEEIADHFIESWRYNHKQGKYTGITFPPMRGEKGSTTASASVSKAPARDPATGGGKIGEILKLHDEGYSNDQIIAAGYNKSTVYRQVNEYKKRKKEVANG